MRRTRETARKRLIREALNGTGGAPIPLEELRWGVLLRESECSDNCGRSVTMTASYQKSFNRSLRTFLSGLAPEMRLHRISCDLWSAGLLARIAVYRLQDFDLINKLIRGESASFHFWTNARTIDIWQESHEGKPGDIEIINDALVPKDAPSRIEPLWFTRGGWPRSGLGRWNDLAAMGPKWIKRPLVCVRICTRVTPSPSEADILAVARFPKNRDLCVIAPEVFDASSLSKVPVDSCQLFLRRRGSTRPIRARQLFG